MLRRASHLMVSVVVLLVVAEGCSGLGKKTEAEPRTRMGDAAPVAGANFTSWLVGSWALGDYVDPNFAKQLGIESIAREMAEQDVEKVFVLDKDGSFVVKPLDGEWKIGGRYTVAANRVSFSYQTFNGKEINAAREELMRRADTGRQGAIRVEVVMDWVFTELLKLTDAGPSPDGKRLIFTGNFGNEANPTLPMGRALERLQ